MEWLSLLWLFYGPLLFFLLEDSSSQLKIWAVIILTGPLGWLLVWIATKVRGNPKGFEVKFNSDTGLPYLKGDRRW